MSRREQLTLAAGLAVCLCTAALFPMFAGSAWVWRTLGAVGVVVAAGLIGRRLSLPRVLQPLLGLLLLAGYLVLLFAGGTLQNGLPTAQTGTTLRHLLDTAGDDINRYRAPVPTGDGLVLLSAAGVGVVAVLVDLLAVTRQRAAMAGLPLLALFAVPAAVVPGGLGGLPFVLGAAGWLLVLLVEGRDVVDRWGSSPQNVPLGASSLGRMSRRIGVSALGVAVIVPLLVPGLNRTLVGGTGGAGDGPGGSSSAHTYNPITRLQSQLLLPKPHLLFAYSTDDPDPDYVRMTTLDRYDGNGWSASPLSQRREGSQVQKGIPAPVDDGATHQDLTMRVTMNGARLDVFWLPLPYGPTKVDVQGTWLWDPASQTAFSASRTTKNLPTYTVSASRVLPDRQSLAAASSSDIDAGVRTRYATGIPVTDAVRRLTEQVVAGRRSPYARAVALQDWFTDADNGFVYDLRPPRAQPGQDPLEAFLVNRRGFCEQYATAMAAMLRVAGIPSRVAVGFTRGTSVRGVDPDGTRTYQVTTKEAHAWPEAWFAGTGWIRFEPTPHESGATIPDYTRPGTVTPTPGKKPGASSPTPRPSATPKRSLPENDLLKGGKTRASARATGHHWATWLLSGAMLVLVAAGPALLTGIRRHRRWRQPDPLVAWEQLREDAADVGYEWNPADSPRAAVARLRAQRRLPPPAAEALDRIAVAAERARFAPTPPGPQRSLERDVATVRTALQAGTRASVRLRARLCPPSTLRWAADSSGQLRESVSARTSARVDAQLARVKHVVRR